VEISKYGEATVTGLPSVPATAVKSQAELEVQAELEPGGSLDVDG
jgi:hypothetical protein